MSPFTKLSKHLLTMGVRAMGRQSFILVTFCCFGMGMMVLVLKQVGTELMESDLLKMSVNTSASWYAQAFRTRPSLVETRLPHGVEV